MGKEWKMSDLISREAAIREIRKCRFVVDAIEKIRRLPSAQPIVPNCDGCWRINKTAGKTAERKNTNGRT